MSDCVTLNRRIDGTLDNYRTLEGYHASRLTLTKTSAISFPPDVKLRFQDAQFLYYIVNKQMSDCVTLNQRIDGTLDNYKTRLSMHGKKTHFRNPRNYHFTGIRTSKLILLYKRNLSDWFDGMIVVFCDC